MATYTTRLSAQARAQHVPLGQALREYAGAANRDKLLSLLLPVQRAAEHCDWLRPMIDAGEIFHPLRWGPAEASRFLHSLPELESAGVIIRMPATWRANRPARPRVTATVGSRKPSSLGLDGVLDFRMSVILDGEPLTEEEVATLLAGTDDLVLLRGQWVEVDRARFEKTMDRFREAEALAARNGLSFAEAMRMLAGASVTGDDPAATDADWSRVTAGPWLEETLKALRAGGRRRTRSRSGAERHVASLSAHRRAMDALAVQSRPWRLSGRRHGTGKDHPGAVAAAGGASCWSAEPAGRAGLAAGQLGGGNREIRPRPEGGDRAPVGDVAPSRSSSSRRRGLRPGDHQLWLAAAHARAGRDVVALRHPGRGAGDQESRPPGRPRRQRRCRPGHGSR